MNTRNEIVSAAEVLFAERGIFSTHIIDIANKLKISKKTVYKYFESKEALVSVVFKSRIDFFNHSVSEIFNSEKPFPEKIAEYVLFLKHHMQGLSQKYLLVIRKFSPFFDSSINQYIENAIFNRFRTLMERGKEEDCLKPNVNIDSTILLFRDAILNFYALLSGEDLPVSLRNFQPAELLYESVITIFRGVLNNEAKKEFDYLLQDDTL